MNYKWERGNRGREKEKLRKKMEEEKKNVSRNFHLLAELSWNTSFIWEEESERRERWRKEKARIGKGEEKGLINHITIVSALIKYRRNKLDCVNA
jgi:hypothetical protein